MSCARQMLGTYPGDVTFDAGADVLAAATVMFGDCAVARGADPQAGREFFNAVN